MNPPDDSLWKWLSDNSFAIAAAVTALFSTLLQMVWSQNNRLIRANAEATEQALLEHKATSERAMAQHQELNARMHQEAKNELSIHRQHIAKLFENAERSRENLANQLVEMRADTNDRLLAISDTQAKQHVALLTAIHQVANAKRDK